jgi:Zn-dependent protease/predicted transcriptional regulator
VGSTFTLGRIAGIPLGVNWSWLVVFALIVWTWATGVFPETNPGYSDATYVALAVVGAILFFGSIVLHEYGHAIQATREGMEIDGITLWLFGGVARFKGNFPSAGAEFRIAVAGPLVSLALGVIFVLLAWLAGLPETVDAVAAWLGYLNLTLLVFNLIPALPLDGGRVLRSILWAAKDDFVWATRIAAAIGRAFGYLFIAAGVAMLIFQGTFSGAWLAFIGWFLLMAASAEDRFTLARQALQGLRVRDLVVRDLVTTRPDVTIGDFMDEIVWKSRHTTYPVTDNGHALGLLPFRCVAEVPRTEWETRTVRECMVPASDVPTVSENDELIDAAAELSESDLHRALVVDGDDFVGLLSEKDVARALEIRRASGGLRRART